MMNDSEKKMLDMMSKNLLLTKGEIFSRMEKEGVNSSGANISLGKLVDMGYVEKIESLGICYAVTQAGIRTMKTEK